MPATVARRFVLSLPPLSGATSLSSVLQGVNLARRPCSGRGVLPRTRSGARLVWPRGHLDRAVTSSLSPARWASTQTPVGLMVIRLLIVANIVVLAAVGALSALFFARPAGIVIALVVWAVAAVLLGLVPYTNPRRGSQSRW
jgi:hypothetical protein